MSFITPQDEFVDFRFGLLSLWFEEAGDYYEFLCMLISDYSGLAYSAIVAAAGRWVGGEEASIFADHSAYTVQFIPKSAKWDGYRLALGRNTTWGTGNTVAEIRTGLKTYFIHLPFTLDDSLSDADWFIALKTSLGSEFDKMKSNVADVNGKLFQLPKTSLRSAIRTVSAELLQNQRYESFEIIEDQLPVSEVSSIWSQPVGKKDELVIKEGYYMSFFSTLSILLPNEYSIDQNLSELMWREFSYENMRSVILSRRFASDENAQSLIERTRSLPYVSEGANIVSNMGRASVRWYYPLQGQVLYEASAGIKKESYANFTKVKNWLRDQYSIALYKLGEHATVTDEITDYFLNTTGAGALYQGLRRLFS